MPLAVVGVGDFIAGEGGVDGWLYGVVCGLLVDEVSKQGYGGLKLLELVLDGGCEVGGGCLVGAFWVGGLVGGEEGCGCGEVPQIVVGCCVDVAGGVVQ